MTKLEGHGCCLSPSGEGPDAMTELAGPLPACANSLTGSLTTELSSAPRNHGCFPNTPFPSLLLCTFSPRAGPSIWNLTVLPLLSYLVPLSYKTATHHPPGSFPPTLSGWPGHLSSVFPQHSVHSQHSVPQTICPSAVTPVNYDSVSPVPSTVPNPL